MMKRLISLLLAMMISLGICCAETTPVPDGEQAAGMLVGGWQPVPAEARVLPEGARAAFDKATEGLTGASYTPVALLSTQVVAGTNYCILCQITPVVPNAVPAWSLVYIYADLEGNAEILNVYELYIDQHAFPSE